jgi:hypothetical protein
MNADQNQISVSGSISGSRRTDELSRYRYLYGFSGSWSDCTGMYGTGTCKVFRIRIQWMQIKIRLVCPDPNFNKAQILDPDSMNPDPKHSYRYVSISGSRHTDELSRYRYLYGFSGSWSEILVQLCTVPVPVQFSGSGFNECRSKWDQCVRIQIVIKLKFWIQIQ